MYKYYIHIKITHEYNVINSFETAIFVPSVLSYAYMCLLLCLVSGYCAYLTGSLMASTILYCMVCCRYYVCR